MQGTSPNYISLVTELPLGILPFVQLHTNSVVLLYEVVETALEVAFGAKRFDNFSD